MAITVQNLAAAMGFEISAQVYMLGGMNRAETREMLGEFKDARINIGDHLLFRYPVVDPNNPTLDARWYLYPVCCPKCGRPTVYFFADFGPGCSGMNGGCGYKVAREKRPWYTPPYIHEGEIRASPPKK